MAVVPEGIPKSPGPVEGNLINPTPLSPLQQLEAKAGTVVKSSFQYVGGAALNIFGFGGAAGAISEGADLAGHAAAETGGAINTVAKSAGSGIEKGFEVGTFLVVAIVGLWVWSMIRPR